MEEVDQNAAELGFVIFNVTNTMQLTKQHWVYLVVTIGFLAQILLSQALWYSSNRQFFLVPMFAALPLNIGDLGNMILFIGLLLSLIIGEFYFNQFLK